MPKNPAQAKHIRHFSRLKALAVAVLIFHVSPSLYATEFFQTERYSMEDLNDVSAAQFISALTLIDVDADGDLDAVVTSWDFFTDEQDPMMVMLNDGHGVFTPTLDPPMAPATTVGSQHWPLTGDFNGDGFDDFYFMAMGNEGGEELITWWTGGHHQLFIQSGSQGLVSPGDSSAIDERRSVIHSAAVGDIDNDGDLDIFNGSLSWNEENVAASGVTVVGSHFFINDGAANLTRDTSRLDPGFAEFGYHIADSQLVDIDNDGDLDLLLNGSDLFRVAPEDEIEKPAFSIFLNDGSGNFVRAPAGLVPQISPFVPDSEDWAAYNMQHVDIDGDGWQDVLITITGPALENGNVQLLMNNRDGSFTDATKNIILDTPWSPETGGGYVLRFHAKDFNGDSWPDLYTLGSGINNRFFVNQGDGTLVESNEALDDVIKDGTNPMDTGDVDGDGDNDIVVGNACNPDTVYCPALLVARNVADYQPVTPPALPDVVNLSQPVDEAQSISPPELSWNHVAGAQNYRVQMNQSPFFTGEGAANLDFSWATGNRLDVALLKSLSGFNGLRNNTRYYWRVAALGHKGQGPWSDTRTFDYGEADAFTINAGINDAWYNPETDGQGFFVTVFPDSELVFLSWFTYDTALPPPDATANLGDPGHRWLTAVGTFIDNQVVMDISFTSGGIFDTATDITRDSEDAGTIILTFRNCGNGMVEYDIPSIDQTGIVPIQRISNDNVALCEMLEDQAPTAENFTAQSDQPKDAKVTELPALIEMNAGLNDAWYNPVTDGQGFFVTVFPDIELVFVSWFTYDTTLPPEGTTANLGDPGHRWMTAAGKFDGNQAVTEINFTSGGIFDSASDILRTDPPGSDGTLTLSFENCNSGTVEYDIPSIDQIGTVPIQRISNDNIELCAALTSQ